jgi:hypothetical protein
MVSLPTLVVAAGLFLRVAISPLVQGEPGRMRPPAAVTCPRNDLTVYAGRVTKLEREKGATSLTIATDSKTTERSTIRHPESADPDASFLLKGKPFTKADWNAIAPKGALREGVRANAWVCRDGRVIVDFDVPPSTMARSR